jgi:hypothetical protein
MDIFIQKRPKLKIANLDLDSRGVPLKEILSFIAFRDNFAQQMAKVGKERDIYIAGVRKDDIYWNVQDKSWVIARHPLTIRGREEFLSFLERNHHLYPGRKDLIKKTKKKKKPLSKSFFIALFTSP